MIKWAVTKNQSENKMSCNEADITMWMMLNSMLMLLNRA